MVKKKKWLESQWGLEGYGKTGIKMERSGIGSKIVLKVGVNEKRNLSVNLATWRPLVTLARTFSVEQWGWEPIRRNWEMRRKWGNEVIVIDFFLKISYEGEIRNKDC